MSAEVIVLVKDIAIILLAVSATVLCVTFTVGSIKLFPSLRRTARHLDSATASTAKISSDFAQVSADIAANVQKGTASMANAAENIASASKDVADVTPLLKLLGPALKAVDFAEMGIERIPGLLQRIIRRN